MLVEMSSNPRSRYLALVHPQIKSSGVGGFAFHSHCRCGQAPQFNAFFIAQLRVVRDMAIGTDQEVPRVLREEIHQNEARVPTMNDEPFLVSARWRSTKRTLFRRGIGGFVIAMYVGHPIRRPQTIKTVGNTSKCP